MNEKYIKMLELDKVLQMLSNEASIDNTKEIALKLSPVSDLRAVTDTIKNTEDAYLLIARYASPSFGKISDCERIFQITEVGGLLNPGDLLNIAEILRVVRSVKSWKENCKATKTSIDCYFDALTPNKFFEEKILGAIKEDETLYDNASPALYDIRRKISNATQNIRSRLDKIVKTERNKYLQDAIVTQRDGRFVVPVKNEYKSEVPGIVHDTSVSGATLFVEPVAVVEINNELRVLKAKEKAEIDRIIAELSANASEFSDSIFASYRQLIKIDLIFAKASLAYKMKASVPRINNDGKIKLKNARHPLINPQKVVPINIELGFNFDSLIVTGPNTGGKTVSLKTVGLLTLMTMCGLMIPVDDNSDVSVFNNVLVDIGDEQSIEQNLSTFSSHMVNIVSMLEFSKDKALVLIDELGAGTDPVEGAALAKSILINFKSDGAKIIATTHYAELKEYAINTDGVENASCEFDIETLKPTYRFSIGIPGRSNAFAISQKLGLPESIISDAKGYLTEDSIKFEKIAVALDKARKDAENERLEVSKLKSELYEKKQKIDSQLNDLEAKKDKITQKAREDAERLLDDARFKANTMLNSLEDMKKDMSGSNAADIVARARAEAKKSLENIENITNPVEYKKDDENYILPRPLVIGDSVILGDIGKDGTVTKINGDTVFVAVGNLVIKSFVSNLRLNENKKPEVKKTRNVSRSSSGIDRIASTEVDIRGMNSEEGIMTLDKFLDDALLNGFKTVTVIHGKGTGVLRQSVHSYLKKRKGIESYRLGTFGEGEMGVTVVTLSE